VQQSTEMTSTPVVLMQAATLSPTVAASFPPSSATTLPSSAFFFDVLPITTNCIPLSGLPPPATAATAPAPLLTGPAAEPAEADGMDGTLTLGRIRSRLTYLYFLLDYTTINKSALTPHCQTVGLGHHSMQIRPSHDLDL